MTVKTQYHYDDLTDTLTTQNVQDVSPILKDMEKRREVMSNKPVGGLGYYAGTIPDVIVEAYMREVGVNFHEFLNDPIHIKRIMNDPDYKKFRVWQGRI